jgi:hypothetical protein
MHGPTCISWAKLTPCSLQAGFQPDDAFPMGDYVREGGIRLYPYSFDMEVSQPRGGAGLSFTGRDSSERA